MFTAIFAIATLALSAFASEDVSINTPHSVSTVSLRVISENRKTESLFSVQKL